MSNSKRLVIFGSLLVAFVLFVAFAIHDKRGNYGLALFLGSPFWFGFLAGMLAPVPANSGLLRKSALIFSTVIALLALTGAVVIAGGMDGLLCILMASPLILVTGMAGGLVAMYFRLAETKPAATMLLYLLGSGALLTLTGMEPLLTSPPALQPVVTQVEIDAPPEAVWKNVVSFDTLPPATEWYFRAGIAAPLRARIEGNGVGAVRHCEFTTGEFVEPVTIWDKPCRLAFDVMDSPAPLQELSPYPQLQTAHLDGYFISRRGEFLLTPLPDGRTLLQGTTWYENKIRPDIYWRLWSDAIVHRIHLRVLNHIKTLSEAVS